MILGFYGLHNSGKTTLIEKLIPEIRSGGFSVASVKNIPHEFSMDTEGKDTFRHRKAGSGIVAASSENETAFVFGRKMNLSEIIALLGDYDYDVILIEGHKHESIKKVRVGSIEPQENTVLEYNQGDDLTGILDYISREVERERKERSLESKGSLRIEVDGKELKTNRFVKKIMKNAIFGLVASLKGGENAREINVKIKLK
jgi:molybdopterin-guanine dinucleotide biosynthesis protein B